MSWKQDRLLIGTLLLYVTQGSSGAPCVLPHTSGSFQRSPKAAPVASVKPRLLHDVTLSFDSKPETLRAKSTKDRQKKLKHPHVLHIKPVHSVLLPEASHSRHPLLCFGGFHRKSPVVQLWTADSHLASALLRLAFESLHSLKGGVDLPRVRPRLGFVGWEITAA